jgi:hypothetical protein
MYSAITDVSESLVPKLGILSYRMLVYDSYNQSIYTEQMYMYTHTHLQWVAMGWTIWGSNSDRNKIFSLLQSRPDRLWVPPSLLFNWFRGSFPGANWPVRKFYHSPPYNAEVRMCGAIYLLPLYVFMAWTGATLLSLSLSTYIYTYIQRYVPSTYRYMPFCPAKRTVK